MDDYVSVTPDVLRVNREYLHRDILKMLEEHPELVNKDPYGDGWLIKIKPTDTTEMDELLDAEAYKQIINE